MTPLSQDQLVHLGYSLMLMALLARDILWLRGILVVSQSILAWYAWYRGVLPIAFWNIVFVCINTVWVIRILRERAAVKLPEDLRELHEKHFAALAAPEFLRLWSWGERRKLGDALLVREGRRPDALFYLLQGEVAVLHGASEVTHCGPGNFIGEMSLLTGEPATADVRALGEVELMCWPAERLAQLRQRNAGLWTKIQSVLGHNLVEKIRRASENAR